MRHISIALVVFGLLGCHSDTNIKQWGVAEPISFEETHDAFSPRIVSAGPGHAWVTWLRRGNDMFHIDVTGYAEPNGWGDVLSLGSPESVNGSYPAIAANDNGNAAVMFERNINTGGTEIAAFWLSSEGFWTEIQAPTATGMYNTPIRAVMDSHGKLHALWIQVDPVPNDQGPQDLYSSYYSPGIGWAPSELIESGPGPVIEATLDVNARGDAIAVWSQHLADGDSAIFANHSPAGQGWGTAQQISSLPDGGRRPSVVVDPQANAVAAWVQSDATPSGIYVSEYEAGIGWRNDVRMGSAFQSQRGPNLAVDGGGRVFIVWSRQRDSTMSSDLTFDIVASYRLSAGEWTELEEIDRLELRAFAPHIVGLHEGGAIAVWRQYEVDVSKVFASRFLPGIGWGDARALGNESTHPVDDISPQIAIDSEGNAITVWTDATDSNGRIVFANRYK